ncbi:MAG TPA: LytTR family DNA-binding domain-containing protein [Acidobacteriaceae bacterium]|nr:LytTR family DNA-binding domain-containing protein [Acidobacteriaceae bacterium]
MTATPARELFEALQPEITEIGSARRIDSAHASAKTAGMPPPKYLTRIAVRAQNRIVLVSFRDVLWIQSHGNLLRLHLQNATYEHRMTIQEICRQLDPEKFFRVHRGAIVNLDHVVEFHFPRHGMALVHMRNGLALPISKARRPDLKRGLLSAS